MAREREPVISFAYRLVWNDMHKAGECHIFVTNRKQKETASTFSIQLNTNNVAAALYAAPSLRDRGITEGGP